jgi:hypothetical protein
LPGAATLHLILVAPAPADAPLVMMVVTATMSTAAAVAPAAAMAGLGLLVALETTAAMVPAATAEVMLGLGIETGPARKTATEAIERGLPEPALRGKTGEVLAPAKTAAPKIASMREGADAAVREEITPQRRTKMAAAELSAAPAAMDPEFAPAAEVAPEEGTVVPAAIKEDRAVIDRQVVIVVGAAVSGIAIAIAAGIILRVGLRAVARLTVTRSGAGIALVITRRIALLRRVVLLRSIALLRSITLLRRIALLRTVALRRSVALFFARTITLVITGPLIIRAIVLIGLRAGGARQRAQGTEGDDGRFERMSHGLLHLRAHEDSSGVDVEDERRALNPV